MKKNQKNFAFIGPQKNDFFGNFFGQILAKNCRIFFGFSQWFTLGARIGAQSRTYPGWRSCSSSQNSLKFFPGKISPGKNSGYEKKFKKNFCVHRTPKKMTFFLAIFFWPTFFFIFLGGEIFLANIFLVKFFFSKIFFWQNFFSAKYFFGEIYFG